MMNISNLFSYAPLWIWAGGAGLLILLVMVILVFAVKHKKKRQLLKDLKEALEFGVFPENVYTSRFLLKRGSIIETFARESDPVIISLTGLDKIWLTEYKNKPTGKLLKKIMEFAPNQGMFTCFLGVMKKPKLSQLFFSYIGTEPGTLRKLPLSGSGEAFDSLEAKVFFKERMDEIREMAGDPEWSVRYFAVKLLVTEEDERSRRVVREAFVDSHPLVRRTVIEEETFMGHSDLYPLLYDRMINDPSKEVRAAAYRRIMKDFSDVYSVDYDKLDEIQTLHALHFLDPEREEDVDTAFKLLKSDNLELRFPAAVFLQDNGFLGKILSSVDFTDTEIMDRNIDLLVKAVEVNIDGFLDTDIEGTAPLFAAVSILKKSGNRSLIAPLAERFFRRGIGKSEYRIWMEIVNAIYARGDEAAVSVLMEELDGNIYDEKLSVYILKHIPLNMESVVYPHLLKILLNPDYKSRDALIGAINMLPPGMVLPDLFKILYGGRDSFPHIVRISALKILAGYKLPYCVQPLIEELPTLPVSEARDFSLLLSSYSGELFNERVLKALEGEDAKVRASVIASLPETGVKEFLKPIKRALSDADPDVRIASVWALSDYGDGKTLNQAIEMLRDPVERVRIAAAMAIGTYASAENLQRFMDVVRDPNEVVEVKKAVIKGLSKSPLRGSVDFLVRIVDENSDLQEAALGALALKTTRKDIKAIIENIKDASPALREKIMLALKKMGYKGEETIAELLEEDIASLKDQINQILEESGYVEHKVRLLSHRDPGVRRETAAFLSRLGSKAAFRGIVLAARDPEEDVRVEVTRALEKLQTESGKEILNELKNDPDKRVRKYTLWALERVHAKSLKD